MSHQPPGPVEPVWAIEGVENALLRSTWHGRSVSCCAQQSISGQLLGNNHMAMSPEESLLLLFSCFCTQVRDVEPAVHAVTRFCLAPETFQPYYVCS
jgi:hypothetical protein